MLRLASFSALAACSMSVASFLAPPAKRPKQTPARHFIFGYGSLISLESRAYTVEKDIEYYPAYATGLRRSWNARGLTGPNIAGVCEGVTAVAVQVTNRQEDMCNGMLFALREEDLTKYDEREEGYRRVKLLASALQFVDGKASINLEGAAIWVYEDPAPQAATTAYPILQSYVDVIIAGALGVSEQYARDFISGTMDWDGADSEGHSWIDDRAKPIYLRPSPAAAQRADEIDALLLELQPEAFRRRWVVNIDYTV